jgi:hypothetical protein
MTKKKTSFEHKGFSSIFGPIRGILIIEMRDFPPPSREITCMNEGKYHSCTPIWLPREVTLVIMMSHEISLLNNHWCPVFPA